MKLWQDTKEDFFLLRIINMPEFNVVKDSIKPGLNAAIRSSPYSNLTVDDLINVFSNKIYQNDDNFALWVSIKNGMVVSHQSTFIVNDDNFEKSCLFYTLYMQPGMMNYMINNVQPFIKYWAKERDAVKFMLATTFNPKSYLRLLNRYNNSFRISKTILEMEI